MNFVIESKCVLKDEITDLIYILNERPQSFISSYTLKNTGELSKMDLINSVSVGSLEFVRKSLSLQGYSNVLKPIEVPYFLQTKEFLKRDYHIVKYDDFPLSGKYFVKDASHLKGSVATVIDTSDSKGWMSSSCFFQDNQDFSDTNFVVSEPLDIASEFRVIVSDDEVQGVQFYNGDHLAFPDSSLIKEIVTEIKRQRICYRLLLPQAYTLDIGTSDRGTFLIEMHNFVFCGTYGFTSQKLPYLYADGIYYEQEYSKRKHCHLYEKEYDV